MSNIERMNFKIESSGWQIDESETVWGMPVRRNAKNDIWEITLPDGETEQLFSYGAAVREVSKVGKRLPDIGDWMRFFKKAGIQPKTHGDWQEDETVRKLIAPSFIWFRHTNTGSYYDQGARAYFWAKGENRSVGFAVGISATHMAPFLSGLSNCGFSVRCVE